MHAEECTLICMRSVCKLMLVFVLVVVTCSLTSEFNVCYYKKKKGLTIFNGFKSVTPSKLLVSRLKCVCI